MKKHTITVAAVKGGTGKTTLVGALAECSARDGLHTLAIDIDPQTNLTRWHRADQSRKTVQDVLHGTDPAEVIQPTAAGFDLIPATADLITETMKPGSADRLARALERVNHDVIVIDTPPFMGELMINAIYAATEVVIPLDSDICAVYGMDAVFDICERVKQSKRGLKVSGVLVDMYDPRGYVNADLRDIIEDTAKKNHVPYLGEVRKSVKVREARAIREPLYEHAPRCSAAVDLKRIYDQLVGGGKS